MSAGFLRYRRSRRSGRRRSTWSHKDFQRWKDWLFAYYPMLFTALIALFVSTLGISILGERLRPVLLTAARTQTQNMVTAIAEEAILRQMEQCELTYGDFVRIERDQDGLITAISTDMAAMNQLRGTLVEAMLEQISVLDETAIAIPVGSLIDSELVWGRGPSIKVRAFTVGTVSASFRSEFLSAGINQTLHRIWFELSIPASVLLPGTQVEVEIDTELCIAETVIVGKVPNYVQKA